jgi:hypothetical protein
MIRLDQTRCRPMPGCGSIASIVCASRAIIPWRIISWMVGAYLRRSSAVHAICRLLGRNDKAVLTVVAFHQNANLIKALAFGQGLSCR